MTRYLTTVSILWGLQLAMIVALAATMGGLAHRLRRPLMQALAWHWAARASFAAFSLSYFLLPDPTSWSAVVLAAGYGASSVVLLPVDYVTARCAAEAPDRLPPFAWRRMLLLGALAGAGVHVLSGVAFDHARSAAALWTRVPVYVASALLVWWLATRWRTYPEARHRMGPLLTGAFLASLFLVLDAVLRWRGFRGTPGSMDGVLIVMSSLAVSLIYGVASLLAALESERDAMAEDTERLRVASVQAAESERLQSLGALASGVAHDFNNLLGVILTGADFTEQALDADDRKAAQADLDEMRAAAQRGAALTRRLLAYARRNPERPTTFSASGVLRDLEPMLERFLPPRIQLRTAWRSELAITMDRAQFDQIVMNLVVNARDALPEGGTVAVELDEFTHTHERRATVGMLTQGRWLRVRIQDDGMGIPEAVRPHLFEAFFTTKGDRGTGLGLATVAAAVHEAGGAIDVESVPDQGTCFDVWLPVAAEGAGATAAFPTRP